jgi:hypothetical protein
MEAMSAAVSLFPYSSMHTTRLLGLILSSIAAVEREASTIALVLP